jgi:hypothetical protein
MDDSRDTAQLQLDQAICVRLFTASAAMLGACLAVIGLIRALVSARRTEVFSDPLLAANAVTYLAACLAFRRAMRTRSLGCNHPSERCADLLLLGSLVLTGANATSVVLGT